MINDFKVIQERFAMFEKEASARVYQGNKAAGVRARKLSMCIEKLLRGFRKESVKNPKEDSAVTTAKCATGKCDVKTSKSASKSASTNTSKKKK